MNNIRVQLAGTILPPCTFLPASVSFCQRCLAVVIVVAGRVH